MKSIESFRGDCDIRVWLCQIAKNCYYSYIKKADRTECIDNVEIAEQGASFEERLFRHDTAMQIQKILHDVPEPYKEVFMWRVYAELSFKQIGQIFGKSENWACVVYHRARNKIKEKLEVY
jgi:RNA polymerase sigma-70 factor (ECF subfamily)